MEENLFQHPAGICIYDKLLFVFPFVEMHLLELLMFLDCYPKERMNPFCLITQMMVMKQGKLEAMVFLSQQNTQFYSYDRINRYAVASSICLGRKILQEFPNVYIGDTKKGAVFKLTDIKISKNFSKGRLRMLYPKDNSITIVPAGLTALEEKLFVASNGKEHTPGILMLHGNSGTLLHQISSDLLPSPSVLCIVTNNLFVTCSNQRSAETTRQMLTFQWNSRWSPHGLVNMGSTYLFVTLVTSL